jgi:hypothetical protein
VVTQFRNSHYDRLNANPNAERYADGWLICTKYRASFYGLLNAANLGRLLAATGFRIAASMTAGQSAIVMARPA